MLISIFSPKGGVGKTTVTLALAESLSKNHRVLALELDFSPGDFISLLPSLDPKKNILTYKHDILSAVQRPQGKNFDVVVGGYPGEDRYIKREDITRCVEILKFKYEYVIVDIQPGIVELVVDVLQQSDKVLVVAEENFITPVARINALLDWVQVNNLSDLRNFVFIRNKVTNKELVYIDKVKHSLKLVHDVPFYKKLKGYDDKRLQKNIRKLAGVLQNGTFRENKKSFFRRIFNI
ncbi:septum site-determining protein MinD [Caldicellulosiruptor bescii]|uniref:ATPase involved in chromosome partitioning-like protein n=2 Tax=Caldicellulosiruptor bescii TaxID=31899 RepID=B9MNJ1_CALBD|nr:ParA family protein [Caldicellulosiruptor bescii]ACM61522.1 ATPase involved in chromosome partitioning-like protein [Caldicellulosiruptor bescii DSM 6725]PBC88666.1 septum site-determining protein MinD [Caldicellulosiruptor bescii]PBC91853.1 septum site-determining protein MinD [Caldicellulosiruptor bescii]PBD02736.1 septum site-determining protein MinD [Caldicellulosiruptor bescii]PBD07647.1 septum site-determining protein MinD [Caldicellulosiruptor bescii]